MGRKNKQQRFAEMKTLENVFEPSHEDVLHSDYNLKGEWCNSYFKNNHPITLELGCGKGEYTIALARLKPEENFIGIDIKGARMWRGATTATNAKLKNVAFLRSRVDFTESFFGPNEVSGIWLTFPDPQPEKRRAKKRLTAPRFLNHYRTFLSPGGVIHLKTDNVQLHEYTIETIKEQGDILVDSTVDLYGEYWNSLDDDRKEILGIKTHYEQLFLEEGKPITYLKFELAT